jgi:hypothetical protein
MYVLMLNRGIKLMSNYDHRLIYPRHFKFRFSVPFLRFLICASAKFERTLVFGRLKTTFSVCTFSGSLRYALREAAVGVLLGRGSRNQGGGALGWLARSTLRWGGTRWMLAAVLSCVGGDSAASVGRTRRPLQRCASDLTGDFLCQICGPPGC